MRAFLHIGAGKTGTSTIQASLARHRELLHRAGLHYAMGEKNAETRAAGGGITSGNGTLLARYMFPDRVAKPVSRQEVEDWLDAIVANAAGRDIVISSEMLQGLQRPHLQELDRMFAARAVQLHVIFYVRHLLDWQISVFAQNVKVGALQKLPPERRTVDGYIAAATVSWQKHLQMLSNTLGRSRLVCRLYDADRPRLVGNFLDAIRPGLGGVLPPESSDYSINRSPNLAEFMLFAAANTQDDPRMTCRDLVDALLNDPPVVDSPALHVCQATFDIFAAREAEMVEKLTAEFLTPEMPLLLTSGRVLIGKAPPPSAEQIAEIAAAAFGRFSGRVRRMAQAQREKRIAVRRA